MRPDSPEQQPRHTVKSYGYLIAGSLHDDALLAHESFVFEHFPSPLVLRLSTRSAPNNQVGYHLSVDLNNIILFRYLMVIMLSFPFDI